MDDFSGWTLVARLVDRTNLAAISQALNQRDIRHHMHEQDDGVALWIAEPSQVAAAIQLLEYLQANPQNQSGFNTAGVGAGITRLIREFPVVAVSILCSVLGALLVALRFDLVHFFTFQDYVVVGDRIGFYPVSDAFQAGQYWRLLTPAFLHFGFFHLAFNCLWVWELGRRIEKLAGSHHLLALMLLTGVTANLGQYAWSGASLFGGMSGVVYGLLGYIWIRHRLSPQPILAVPPGVIIFMLGWLVICMTGFIDLFMSGSVANAAHVGGLMAGVLLGWWAGRT